MSDEQATIISRRRTSLWIVAPMLLVLGAIIGLVIYDDFLLVAFFAVVVSIPWGLMIVYNEAAGAIVYLCSECHGNLPSNAVKTCMHCRAKF